MPTESNDDPFPHQKLQHTEPSVTNPSSDKLASPGVRNQKSAHHTKKASLFGPWSKVHEDNGYRASGASMALGAPPPPRHLPKNNAFLPTNPSPNLAEVSPSDCLLLTLPAVPDNEKPPVNIGFIDLSELSDSDCEAPKGERKFDHKQLNASQDILDLKGCKRKREPVEMIHLGAIELMDSDPEDETIGKGKKRKNDASNINLSHNSATTNHAGPSNLKASQSSRRHSLAEHSFASSPPISKLSKTQGAPALSAPPIKVEDTLGDTIFDIELAAELPEC